MAATLTKLQKLEINWIHVLLIGAPLAIICGWLEWAPIAVFGLAFVALIPLAGLIGYSTELISERTAPRAIWGAVPRRGRARATHGGRLRRTQRRRAEGRTGGGTDRASWRGARPWDARDKTQGAAVTRGTSERGIEHAVGGAGVARLPGGVRRRGPGAGRLRSSRRRAWARSVVRLGLRRP